jgi:hypothetical protein
MSKHAVTASPVNYHCWSAPPKPSAAPVPGPAPPLALFVQSDMMCAVQVSCWGSTVKDAAGGVDAKMQGGAYAVAEGLLHC